jgi:hypothetical protein
LSAKARHCRATLTRVDGLGADAHAPAGRLSEPLEAQRRVVDDVAHHLLAGGAPVVPAPREHALLVGAQAAAGVEARALVPAKVGQAVPSDAEERRVRQACAQPEVQVRAVRAPERRWASADAAEECQRQQQQQQQRRERRRMRHRWRRQVVEWQQAARICGVLPLVRLREAEVVVQRQAGTPERREDVRAQCAS